MLVLGQASQTFCMGHAQWLFADSGNLNDFLLPSSGSRVLSGNHLDFKLAAADHKEPPNCVYGSKNCLVSTGTPGTCTRSMDTSVGNASRRGRHVRRETTGFYSTGWLDDFRPQATSFTEFQQKCREHPESKFSTKKETREQGEHVRVKSAESPFK